MTQIAEAPVLLPIALIVIVLFMALGAALFRAKRRYIDHEPGPENIRPNDREMTASPDLSNPPIDEHHHVYVVPDDAGVREPRPRRPRNAW